MLVQTQELTQPLDLFMCIQCGKCTGGCPIALKTNFNIRALIYNMLVEDKYELSDTETLWDCTTCYTCSTRCPKDVQPADVVMKLRSMLVEKGEVPRTIGIALTSIFRNSNPMELSRADRTAWANGLELKNALEQPVDVLYYVGCMASYDPAAQKIARAMVTTLNKAGVDFGTLGGAETCCGSEVRRVGEMGLFEMLVEEGNEVLASAQTKRMITTSPHCFDVYTHHYADPGYPIQHYTQYISHLIADGQLTFNGEVKKKVTYHDPCYLGKQNKIFDEPRAIIQSIPGVEFIEMDRSRETSLCCEGGGGRMWFDGTNLEVRLAYDRIHEAIDTGAQVIATACPFCLTMLEDAVKTLTLEDQIQVKDIMELVVQAL